MVELTENAKLVLKYMATEKICSQIDLKNAMRTKMKPFVEAVFIVAVRQLSGHKLIKINHGGSGYTITDEGKQAHQKLKDE